MKIGEARILNPDILKLSLTTVLDMGVCHMYFYSQAPQSKIFNDFRGLGETALRMLHPAGTQVHKGKTPSRENLEAVSLAGQDEATNCVLVLALRGSGSLKAVVFNPGCILESQ